MADREGEEPAGGDVDFRALFERITLAAPAAIYINDRRAKRSIYVNPGATRILGYSPDEIYAVPAGGLIDLVHPDDQALVEDMLRRASALGEGEAVQAEYRMRHKDGRWVDMLDRVVALDRDEQGVVIRVMGVAVDITDRRRAEDRLRESESRLRLVQSAGGVGSFDWDMKSGYIHRSPEYLEIHGLPADAFLDGHYSEKWRERIHPDDRAEVERWFAEDKKRVGPFEHEYRIRRASDGAERWIINRGTVLGDARGAPARLLSAQIDVTDRRDAEEALRESEERFRLIADSAPVPIWVTKLDRSRGFVNQAYCAFLGVPYDECLTFDWRSVIHPDDAEALRAASIAGEASLKPFTLEGRYRRADGEWRWLRSESQPRWNADGTHNGFIGVAYDITEAKQAEQALAARANELRLVADALPVLVSYVDAEQRYRFNNKAYEDWFGQPREAIFGKPMEEVLGPAAYARIRPQVERALAGEAQSFEARIDYRDGGPRDVLVDYIPHVAAGGDVAGFYVMVQDVSERKAAELRERRAAAERQAILQQLAEGVIVTDAQGRITFANDAAAALHGVERLDASPGAYKRTFTVTQLDGTPFEDNQMPLTRAFRDGVASTGIRWRLRRPDGVELVLSGGAQPVIGPGGGLIGAVLTFTDDTERKAYEDRLKDLNETLETRVAEEIGERLKAEDSLRQAQKMEAIGKLTGGIAHDFNNLLTVILSSVDLLKRPTISDEKRARYIDAIGETAQRAAALTSQLLAFARRQPLSSESFDAGARLKAMRPVLHTMLGQGVRLTVSAEAGQIVRADPNQFESALLNMAVNARDAMPEGGRLTLRVAADIDPARVAVSVSDTGAGIPADMLQTIFEPFYTTKAVGKGTGLGLSQVYGFAKQSGGRIDVESEPGKGTVFTLRLPRGTLAPKTSERPAPVGEAPPQRILVVEDNRAVGEFAARLLEDMGHDVALEDNAVAALARIEGGEPFDLVFTDVIMPGALDGLGLARKLRRDHAALPVVLTTGYAQGLAEDASHGFDVLRKPYSADALAALIAKAAAKP